MQLSFEVNTPTFFLYITIHVHCYGGSQDSPFGTLPGPPFSWRDQGWGNSSQDSFLSPHVQLSTTWCSLWEMAFYEGLPEMLMAR